MTPYCLISAVKDEGPDLLEWVAYHRLVGFQSMLICSNDCSDGSDDLLDALQGLGWLTHLRHSPGRGQSAQGAAADLALRHPALRGADWAIWLDADEFLNLHCGTGRLADLEPALAGADGLALNWRLFGDSGHDTTTDALVLDRFAQAARQKHRQSRTVKTLFRVTDRITGLDIHRPLWQPDETRPVQLLDAALRPLPQDFVFQPKKNGRPADMVAKDMQAFGIGQINHYAIKALDRVALKQQRGNGLLAGAPGGRFGFRYLRRFNQNDEAEMSIQRHLPALRALIAEALADAALRDAFATCQQRFAAALSGLQAITAAFARDRTGKAAEDGDDD